jgi:hypothetical protein
MDSYDVRFWDIKRLGNGTAARFRVRWAVDGREHCKSFKARPLADGFLTGLKDAVRDRRPFDPRTGLPEAETTGDELITWYTHASSYAEAKWPNLAPVSRRSVAEALVTVTIALTAKEPGAPDAKVLRQALFGWAFNPATRQLDPPPETAAALSWAERASLPVAELEDTATVRLALGACARNLTGKAAAGRPSGASGRCSTTPSATPSSKATFPPTRSTASSGPPPPSPPASTGGWWSARPRPAACWPPSGR